MDNRIELTDVKNQIQWYAFAGISIFALVSIIFTITENYIQAIISGIGFLIVGFFVLIKKQNYKRVFFDKNYLYIENETISLEHVEKIKISKWNQNYGILKIEKNQKTENVYFAGYSKSNLELLKSYLNLR